MSSKTDEKYIEEIRKKYTASRRKKILSFLGTIFFVFLCLIVLYFLIHPLGIKTPKEEFPGFIMAMAFSISSLTFIGIIFLIIFDFFKCTQFHKTEKLLLKYYDKSKE